MGCRWEEAEPLLVTAAADDLRVDGTVTPALAAFAGADLAFLAWLRPFPPGAYHDPLIELLALAGPLDCDRLLLSIGARIWPFDDPPPVDADGDHRQPAIVLQGVDGTARPPRSVSVLYRYTRTDDGPVLGLREEGGAGTGWIPQALESMVAHREQLQLPWPQVAEQAARVERLGHVLCLAPHVAGRLAAAGPADRRCGP